MSHAARFHVYKDDTSPPFFCRRQIHETSAYHDAFEVQTLAYRAPEVIYGLPFNYAIVCAWLGTLA